jgi:hypothetical protein
MDNRTGRVSAATAGRPADRRQQPHGPVDRAGGSFGSGCFVCPSCAAQASRLKLPTGFNNTYPAPLPRTGFPVPVQENNGAAQVLCAAYCCARACKSSTEDHLRPLILSVGIPCLYRMTIASIAGCVWKFYMLYWKQMVSTGCPYFAFNIQATLTYYEIYIRKGYTPV